MATGPAENILPIFPIGPLQVLKVCYKVIISKDAWK